MKYTNHKTEGLSVTWDDVLNTLEINLSSNENADVSVSILSDKKRFYFATGWSVQSGMNRHTFSNVFLLASGKLYIYVRNENTRKLIIKSLLYIPENTP